MKTELKIILLTVVLAVQPLWSQNISVKINLSLKNGNVSRLSEFNFSHTKGLTSILRDSSIGNNDIYVKTDECDIYLKNRSLYKEVNILSLTDSTLRIDKKGVIKVIDVNQINKIKFRGASGFWSGALIGAGISTFGWLITGIAAGESALPFVLLYAGLTFLPSGLVGGLVGLMVAPEDELYDVSGGNPKAKLKRLRYIIDGHK